MTIKVTTTARGQSTVLRVDGWLEGEDSDEVLRVAQSSTCSLVLDLSELHSADTRGLQTIQQLVSQGAEVERVRGYLKFLLTCEARESAEAVSHIPGKAGEQPCEPEIED